MGAHAGVALERRNRDEVGTLVVSRPGLAEAAQVAGHRAGGDVLATLA
jgi:hypothetical protein